MTMFDQVMVGSTYFGRSNLQTRYTDPTNKVPRVIDFRFYISSFNFNFITFKFNFISSVDKGNISAIC